MHGSASVLSLRKNISVSTCARGGGGGSHPPSSRLAASGLNWCHRDGVVGADREFFLVSLPKEGDQNAARMKFLTLLWMKPLRYTCQRIFQANVHLSFTLVRHKHAKPRQDEAPEGADAPGGVRRIFFNFTPTIVRDCRWGQQRSWSHRCRSLAWWSCSISGGNSECKRGDDT